MKEYYYFSYLKKIYTNKELFLNYINELRMNFSERNKTQ